MGKDEEDEELIEETADSGGAQSSGIRRDEEGIEMEDEDGEDNEEAMDSIGWCAPVRPSAEEVEIHNRTHLPYRSWCEICV